MLNTKLLGSVSAGPAEYVEDVFSTYLYTGNGSTQTINNGIDLAGKGGMVWCKGRDAAFTHSLVDSTRGISKWLGSNSGSGQDTFTDAITSFNNNGFTLGADTQGGYVNASTYNFASWTFREAPKFFDVVTYTGNGVAGRTVSHSLGSTPGMMIVKCTSTSGNWSVYHRSTGATDRLILNLTNATGANNTIWNDTAPTSTVFTVGDNAGVNASGATYVAYLFAHDAGGFGAAGTDNVISCGSFTTDGSGNATVSLGYEPQYVMVKRTDSATGGQWFLFDTMRGMVHGQLVTTNDDAILTANTSNAETIDGRIRPTATGFNWNWYENATMIYMAIRRPMKPPTSGTEVFSVATRTGTGSSVLVDAGFPSDLIITANRDRSSESNTPFASRLTGFNVGAVRYLSSNLTDAEATGTGSGFYEPIGQTKINTYNAAFNASGERYLHYFMRRATGFFDVVCYTGDGSSTQIPHNLGAIPELCISKRRAATSSWFIDRPLNTSAYNQGAFDSAAFYDNWLPSGMPATATTIRPPNSSSGQTMVMYLFATLAGVSKVGEYTGDGTDGRVINCGFTGGARFVLIKRIDGTGNWRIWDTARGIVSGNDPFLTLNTTTAESTNSDDIDPTSSGFIINYNGLSAINESGWSYIYLAIA